jgi:DNA invertase Pin-like site-specific DNA recombinase
VRLIGYVRVSSAGQASEDAFGPLIQRRAIQGFAHEHGHKIVRWCEDLGVSGITAAEGRPGLMCCVSSLAAREAEGVATLSLDRLARSLHIQEAVLGLLWSRGAKVFTCEREVLQDDPSDPTRTLIRHVLGAIGQFERQTITNRMQLGRQAKRQSGGYAFGAPPFGSQSVNGKLKDLADEQAVIQRIIELRTAGASFREIANELNDNELKPRRADIWYPQTVSRVIERESKTWKAKQQQKTE